MTKQEALNRVRRGFSEKVFEYIGKGNWREFSHDIGSLRTRVVRKIPDRVFAEHKATGARVLFYNGYFTVEAVNGSPSLSELNRELDQELGRLLRRSRPRPSVVAGGAAGVLLGAAIAALLDD